MDITPIDGKITVFATVSPSLDRDLFAVAGGLSYDEAAEFVYRGSEDYWGEDIDNIEIDNLIVLNIQS